MSKKFTGVHSGGQNIPVYDKDAHSAIEQKLNTSAFQSVSGNFLTAVPDAYATKEYADGAAASAASGKLDTDTFAQVSGDFLTAVPQSYLQNTDLTVTSGKVTEISGIPLSAGGTLPDTIPVSGVSGISVTETENQVLIGISADFATSADLESKLDTSAFSSVSGDFLTAVPDDFATKDYLSGQISGKYDTSSFAEVSGNFLTAVPESAISGFATHEEVKSATSGKADVSALEGLATETYVDSAVSGKQDASAMTEYIPFSASGVNLPNSNFEIDPSGQAYKKSLTETISTSACSTGSWGPIIALNEQFKEGDVLALTDIPSRIVTVAFGIGYGTTGLTANAAVENGSAYMTASHDLDFNGYASFYTMDAGGNITNPGGTQYFNIIRNEVSNEEYALKSDIPSVSGYMATSGLEYDGDKISGYMGSAFKAGDELPEGVMVESAVEYNAVNEISGYNGSAIAQYGAEKQWLVHDDTLVHQSNSAQYALGVNLSAVAQLLGVDETVLWEGSAPLDQSCLVNGTRETATLSEPLSSFNKIRIYAVWNPWIGNFTGCNMFEYPGTNQKGGYIMNDCTNQGFIAGGSWSANETTFKLVKHWQANYPAAKETSDGLGGIFKIVGIGRKQ